MRLWFCQKVLFAHPSRFCEYLLESPSGEVRTAFVRIIVLVAHFSLNDGPAPVPPFLQQLVKQMPANENSSTLSDYLLQAILSLLSVEVSQLNDRAHPNCLPT